MSASDVLLSLGVASFVSALIAPLLPLPIPDWAAPTLSLAGLALAEMALLADRRRQ